VGQRVRHPSFGAGEVINYDRHVSEAVVRVRFVDGVKWLAVNYAKLEKV
jgi:DNA helicase-2/ATP-dependent DNA helicase PcrA